MQRTILYLFVIVTLIVTACTSDPGANGVSNSETEIDSSAISPNNYNSRSITRFTPPQHGCTINGNILPENQLWLEESQVLFVIKADSSTYDKNLGDSHRVLEVYNTEECRRVQREILPINESPDFPYYLAKITYNHSSKLVALRGFKSIFIYDLEKMRLLPTATPKFTDDVFGVDAQSGMIHRIELWENYIVGYSQDYGAFVLNLSDGVTAKPILPFAQWVDEQERPHSMFLLTSTAGGQQLIIPSFNLNNSVFSINPIFEQPQKINITDAAGKKNSRFVVFKGNGANVQGIAIDLKERSLVNLPQNIAQGKNEAILNWLNANES